MPGPSIGGILLLLGACAGPDRSGAIQEHGDSGASLDTAGTSDTADTGQACKLTPDTAGVCEPADCAQVGPPMAGEAIPVTERAIDDSNRYLSETDGGCITRWGDARLACVGVKLALDPITLVASYYGGVLFAPRWIGDLDNDGVQDVLVQRTGEVRPQALPMDRSSWLLYGGERVTGGALADVANGYGTSTDAGFGIATGDVTGDGQDDVLVDVLPADWTYGEAYGMGIDAVGHRRSDSEMFSWSLLSASWDGGIGPNGYWAGAHLMGTSEAQRAFGTDVDGDSMFDIVFSELAPLDAASRVSVVRGSAADMVKGATQWDDATWRISSATTCVGERGDPVACEGVTARPAGDLDGDGVDDLFVVAHSLRVGPFQWRAGMLPLAGTPTCAFNASDVLVAPLRVLDVNQLAALPLSTSADSRSGLAVISSRDLNGDGRPDLVLGGAATGSGEERLAWWFLYGGEGWLDGGGDLMANTDRLEFPLNRNRKGDLDFGPDAQGSTALDMDGDGIDEVVVGYVGDTSSVLAGYPAFLSIAPGTVGGLRGIHEWDDPSLRAVASDNYTMLMAAPGRGDHDADGFEDLLLMGMAPFEDDVQQLDVWLLYGGNIP